MEIKDKIIKALGKVTGIKDPDLQFSSRPDFGDYTTNVAIKNKIDAQNIVEKLRKDSELLKIVETIDVAGPGFINFHLKNDALVNNLKQIVQEKEKYGSSEKNKSKTVIVDYSAPNIAKPFGIGHLRSTIIGQVLYNLYKTLGYKVIGDNHLGDWGTQFGKLIYMIHDKNLDSKNLTIAELEKLYVEFHQKVKEDESLEEKARTWFKKLEDGDKYARQVWQNCISISLVEFNRIYSLLNVKIDYALGESFYEEEMKKMANDEKITKHLLDGEGGAKIIDLTKYGIKTPLMFLKNNGGTTYATRDLATIKYRVKKWNPTIIIYEVGGEQTLHFKQVFEAARILDIVGENVTLKHVAHGLYLDSDGKKFSTRKGKTIKLEEVLQEAIKKAKEFNSNDKVAKEVGIGAIKYFDLMHAPTTDIIFDWDKIFVLEGNSGPYLQYTYARTHSVLSKIENFKIGNLLKTENCLPAGKAGKLEIEEAEVLRSLVKFPEIIEMAAKNYAPNLLCEYLYSLAQKYNTFYNKLKIIASDNEEFRLTLTFGVGQVLKNGLTLLGIATPEKM